MLTITHIINRMYRNNEFKIFVVYGPYGYGKTSYSIKCLAEVYGEYNDKGELVKPCYDWNILRSHFVMHPKDFVEHIFRLNRNGGREKCLVCDDAGLWLFALDWNKPFVKEVAKYLNVARSNLAGLILTTPHPSMILKKIRGLPDAISVKIMRYGDQNRECTLHRRLAVGYLWWSAPDGRRCGVKTIFQDVFDCMLPDDVYKGYIEMRKQYIDWAVLLMKKELELAESRYKLKEEVVNVNDGLKV
ncbi:MAG: hypothetical protein ACKD6O_08120 [Candidatus Bathyarchaeota archaeon]